MERLWMFSVLTGQITDVHWPDSDVSFTASDGTTYMEAVSLYSEDCDGHRGKDVFPFGLLDKDTNDFRVHTGIKGNLPNGGNELTNREALAAFDPRINALPYIYDTFKWEHCVEDGYDLDDAWETGGMGEAGKSVGGGDSGELPRGRATAGGRTIFDKDAPRVPMYGSLQKKLADLKARQMQS